NRMNTVTTKAIFVAFALSPIAAFAQSDPFRAPYTQHCAVCHGANLEGAAQGTPLAGVALRHGSSADAIAKSIADGVPQTAMPAWSATLDATQIRRLAILISEKRSDLTYTDFKIGAPPTVPEGRINSEKHAFRIETVATGLRIVSADGKLSEPIRGTPKVYADGFEMPGILLVYGQGYLLDLALHPDYAKNGWIYLSYTERCNDCNEASRKSKRPVSMNVLVRGRIRNGEWVDQETV